MYLVEAYSVQTEIGRSGGPRRSAEGEEDEQEGQGNEREASNCDE